MLRRKLESPCDAGVEGLHGSTVSCPERSAGCERSGHGSLQRPIGGTRYCLRHLYQGKNALPIFLYFKRQDKHPLKLLVRLTGIFNIMWLYVKGDLSGDWIVPGIIME